MIEQVPTFGQQYGFLVQAASVSATLIGMGWKARGFVTNLVTNHLTHMKDELLTTIKAAAVKEDEGHDNITTAVREGTKETVAAITAFGTVMTTQSQQQAQTIITALKD